MNYYRNRFRSLSSFVCSPKRASTVVLASVLLLIPIMSKSKGAACQAAATKRKAAAPPASDPTGLPPNATPLDHNNLAVALGKRGNWPRAVEEHEAALAGDPYNPVFRMNLSGAYLRYGQALMHANNYKDAIQKFHMALYVDPNNQPATDCLATSWKNLGKDPTNPNFRRDMGDKYEEDGNYPEAISEFRVFANAVDDGPAHFALGRALTKQGKTVPARVVEGYLELKTAVTKDWPKDQQMELGRCHMALADMLKELAYKARDDGRTDTAYKRLQNAAIEYRRAAQIMNNTNLEAARGLVEVSREAVGINDRSFDNHFMLAGGYQLIGDFERAKKEYEVCWRIRPNDPKLAEARLSYHLAVVTSPSVPPMLIAASVQKMEDMLKQPANQKDALLLYIYGRGKDALGDHNTALLAYKRAYEINPYLNPDLAKKLGAPSDPVPQQSKGTKVAALAGGGAALSGSPSTPVAGLFSAAGQSTGTSDSALLASVQNKINNNDLEGAKKDLDEELGKNPSDGKAWFMSGTANEKQGSLEDASTGYRQATFFNVPGAEEALNRVNDLRAKPFLEEGDKKMQSNNFAGANDSYKQATSMAPNNIEAHRKLLEAAKKLGDQKTVDYESETIDKLQKPKQTGAAGSSY